MTLPAPERPVDETADARDLQARLYREIGISAVAAALRFVTQPDPDKAVPPRTQDRVAMLGEDHIAA